MSFELFIILMYQGDIRHSIESTTTSFTYVVGIVKFYFSRVRKLRIPACKTCHRIMMNQHSHLFCRIMARDNLCIVCGKTFVTPERLREHKANMHKIDQITYSCKNCDKMFQNKGLFKTHSRKYHLELPCLDCEKKFGSKIALRTHQKAKHANLL